MDPAAEGRYDLAVRLLLAAALSALPPTERFFSCGREF